MATTRVRGQFEMKGHPRMLEQPPDPRVLADSGAKATAKLLSRALALRDKAREARQAVREAERTLAAAAKQDRAEAAALVARRPDARITNVRTETAEKALTDAQARADALDQAVENQADLLIERGSEEHERLAEAAKRVRAKSVERVERAAAEVEAAVAELQASLSVAKWSASPGERRWRVALGTVAVGRRHGGMEIARLFETLRELPAALAAQKLPDEAEPTPEIHFGWSGLGRQTAPPGSIRSS
jgi:hypothetical protein